MRDLPASCYLDTKDFVRWHLDQLEGLEAALAGHFPGESTFTAHFLPAVRLLWEKGCYEWAWQFLMVYLAQGGDELCPGSVDLLTERFQGIPACDVAVMNYLENRADPEAN